MHQAHVFQHNYSGVQMFVYHQNDEKSARRELAQLVFMPSEWIFLGKKTAEYV